MSEPKAMYQPLKKSYSEDINDLVEQDLTKSGGEGSRGGKVIGHTRSGKPIYDSHNHTAHAGFSRDDHHDAAAMHTKLDGAVKDKKKHPDSKGFSHHNEHSKRHIESAGTKGHMMPISSEAWKHADEHYKKQGYKTF